MRLGVSFELKMTCPFFSPEILVIHGSQVTATSTFPAANAAPASSGFMLTSWMSLSVRPAFSSAFSSRSWLHCPSVAATFFPFIPLMSAISFLARIASAPAEVSVR